MKNILDEPIRFKRQIVLKPNTPDSVYTAICKIMKEQGVFSACGNCDDKWIQGSWEDEVEYTAWIIAMTGTKKLKEVDHVRFCD